MMKSRSVSFGDLLDRLAGVVREDLVEQLAHPDDLLGLDLDVDRLAGRATVRLVDEHPGVREDEALARRAGREQHRRGRRGLADADRLHVGLDVLHRVVDREQPGDLAARRVDVHRDVLVGIFGLEEQQLGDDEVRDRVVDRRAEEDDAVVREPRVDVPLHAAARRLLDEPRDRDVLVADRLDHASDLSSAGSSFGFVCDSSVVVGGRRVGRSGSSGT